MPHLQIITTEDGSHSLLNTELDETYHSKHGAIQESMHVFIKNGLHYFMEQHASARVNILEIGFGTGLNALLTLQHGIENSYTIQYTSLEAYPIPEETWMQLNYMDAGSDVKNYFHKIHRAPWMEEEFIHPNFSILKKEEMLQQSNLTPDSFDVVFFDAFAPNKQPEMWTYPILSKVIQSMKYEAVFVTYCAKGQLKRDLTSLGLKIESLAGPPGKREMIRGIKR